jgi:flagellar motor switch protein FliN/FliY
VPARSDPILNVEVPIRVRVGGRRLPIASILQLQPGDLVELGVDPAGELEVLAGDRVVACGRAVRVGDRFGVRITRVGSRPPDPVPQE